MTACCLLPLLLLIEYNDSGTKAYVSRCLGWLGFHRLSIYIYFFNPAGLNPNSIVLAIYLQFAAGLVQILFVAMKTIKAALPPLSNFRCCIFGILTIGMISMLIHLLTRFRYELFLIIEFQSRASTARNEHIYALCLARSFSFAWQHGQTCFGIQFCRPKVNRPSSN